MGGELTRAVPDADESASILAREISARTPFFFIKLGDGAIECVNGYGEGTCDGERYTPALASELTRAWRLLGAHANLYVGDWMTAAFDARTERTRYAGEYEALMSHAVDPKWLRFDALLLMRETDALLGFWRAVREDPRRKLLLGPASWFPLAELLRCDFLALPMMPNLVDIAPQITKELARQSFDVLLYGAGIGGHVAVVDCWSAHPGRTYVNIGSALDPACSRGRTRSQQLAPASAKAFLNRLLDEGSPVRREAVNV